MASPATTDSTDAAPIVVLVHGTWPHGAPGTSWFASTSAPAWYEPQSAFCRELSLQLNGAVRFAAFTWSGKNSWRARADAATALASRVVTLRRAHPKAPLFLVGHSHGGNVAFQAGRHSDALAALSGIATLATPFLYIRERRRHLMESHHFILTGVVALLALLGGLAVWLDRRGILTNATLVSATVVLGTLVVVAASIVERMALQVSTRVGRMVAESLPIFTTLPVLVLGCAGDEAYVALRLARAAALIAKNTWRALDWGIQRIVDIPEYVLWIGVAWIPLSSIVLLYGLDEYRFRYGGILVLVIVAPAILAFGSQIVGGIAAAAFLGTAGILLLPFGVDLLAAGWFLELQPSAIPAADRKTVVNVRRASGRFVLRHSLHASSDTPIQLADWIRAQRL